MVRPDDGGDSRIVTSDYDSFGSKGVEANIGSLVDYWDKMQKLYIDAAGPSTMEITPMDQMIREGLETPGGDAGVLPEGFMAAQMLRHRQSDIRYFMQDLLEGVRNIGAAAAVVAEMYENVDNKNSVSLADIGFAFSDPGAKGPKDLRKVTSFSDAEAAANADGVPMAASGNDALATSVVRVAAGVTIYYYPDGSSKQVVASGAYTADEQGGTKYSTTVYAPGGAVLFTTIETDVKAGGTRTQTTQIVRGEGDQRTTSTSTIRTDTNGAQTITSESTSQVPDGKGGTTEKKTTSEPITIQPGEHRDQGEVGPVEQAQNELDTPGSDQVVRQYGMGY